MHLFWFKSKKFNDLLCEECNGPSVNVNKTLPKIVVFTVLVLAGAGELINIGKYVVKTIMTAFLDVIWNMVADLGPTGWLIGICCTIAFAVLYVSYKGRSIV